MIQTTIESLPERHRNLIIEDLATSQKEKTFRASFEWMSADKARIV